MGYSHGWNKDVPSVVADQINAVYQASLKVIPAYDDSTVSLYDEFMRAISFVDGTFSEKQEGDHILKSLFCDYSFNDDDEPIMICAELSRFNFIKTNRLRYDAAVYTALALAKNCDNGDILGLDDSYNRLIKDYIDEEGIELFISEENGDAKSAITEEIIKKLEAIYDEYSSSMQDACDKVHYTSWSYDCKLSRQLTRDEYVEFVQLVEPMTCGWHIDTFESVDLLKAYEDSFKSYDLRTELNTIVQFFVSKGIECHGEFTWDSEESGDQGKIVFKGRMFSEASPEYSDSFLEKACKLLRSNGYGDAADLLEENFD